LRKLELTIEEFFPIEIDHSRHQEQYYSGRKVIRFPHVGPVHHGGRIFPSNVGSDHEKNSACLCMLMHIMFDRMGEEMYQHTKKCSRQILSPYSQRGRLRSRYTKESCYFCLVRTSDPSQIRELVEYSTRGRPDDERASVLQSFKDMVGEVTEDKSEEMDLDRRRAALELVLGNTKGVGQGTEQGMSFADNYVVVILFTSTTFTEIEGFFNLLFSHLLILYPDTSPEARQRVTSLLSVLSASPSEQSSVKYRVYVGPQFMFFWVNNFVIDYQTCSTQHQGRLPFVCPYIPLSCSLQCPMANSRSYHSRDQILNIR